MADYKAYRTPSESEFRQWYGQQGYTTDEIDQLWGSSGFGFDYWDAFKLGLKHGYEGLKQSTGDLVNMAAPGYGYSLVQDAKREMANSPLPADLRGRLYDNPELLKDPRTWAYGFGQVFPSVGLSIGMGGLGYLATGSRWAAAIASGVAGGAMEAGPTYEKALELGQQPGQARLSALEQGLAVTGLNAVPAARLFGPIGKLGRLGKATQVGMAEAVTEVAEGPAEAMILGTDVYQAFKDELNVAPGSFLAGALFGSFGSRRSPMEAQAEDMAMGGDPEQVMADQTMGPSREDMVKLQEEYTFRQYEEERMWQARDGEERAQKTQEDLMWRQYEEDQAQGVKRSQDVEKAYRDLQRQADLDQQVKASQEDEVFNIMEPALDLPQSIEQELIASKLANAASSKELNQMQGAFANALVQLPSGVQDGVRRTGLVETRKQQAQRDDPARLLPPIAEQAQNNPVQVQNRAMELADQALTGSTPVIKASPAEQQAVTRAVQNVNAPMQQRSYPQGVSVQQTPRGHAVVANGQPVASFKSPMQAEVFAQLYKPEVQVPDLPLPPLIDQMGEAKTRFTKAMLDGPAQSQRLQVSSDGLTLLSNDVTRRKAGDTSAERLGTIDQANYQQAVMLDRAMTNLTAWGMPSATLIGLDGVTVHRGNATGSIGAYIEYANGDRTISLDGDMLGGHFQINDSQYPTFALAHELGHHLGNEYALRSELFQPTGAVAQELNRVYRNQDEMGVWRDLTYPMMYVERVAEDATYIPKIAKEAFAQLHAIYYTYGSTDTGRAYLKALMPRSMQLMDEVKRALNTATTQQRATALHKAFRLRSTPASDSPVVTRGPAVVASEVPGGGRTGGGVQEHGMAGTFRADYIDRRVAGDLTYTNFEALKKPNGQVYAEIKKQGLTSPDEVLSGIDSAVSKVRDLQPIAFRFYDDVGQYLAIVSNGDRSVLDRYARTLAILSTDSNTARDFAWWRKAVDAMQTAERDGGPMSDVATQFVQYPEAMRGNIDAAQKAEAFTRDLRGVGPKVMAFYQNLMDGATGKNRWPNAVVVDNPTFKEMGGTGKGMVDERSYRLGTEMLRQVTDEVNQAIGSNWLPRHIQSALTGAGDGKAAQFAAQLQDQSRSLTASTVPSPTTSTWAASLPVAQSKQFDAGTKALIIDKQGNDLLSKVLGLPGFSGDALGGQLPGVATLRTSQRFNRQQVRAYARGLQYIYQLDQVPWFRPDPTAQHNAVVLTTRGGLNENEMDTLQHELGAGVGFHKIGPDTVLLTGDNAFQAAERAIDNERIESAQMVGVETESGPVHNWAEDPKGKRILDAAVTEAISAPGGSRIDPSVLREWLSDRHATHRKYQQEQRAALSHEAKIGKVDYMEAPEHEPRFENQRPNTEYAGSINRKHWVPNDALDNEAAVWEITEGMNQEFEKEFVKQRRGVRSWGTTERAAAALGMSEESLIKTKIGRAGNAEQLERARFLAVRAAEDLTAANKAYRETHSDQDAIALETARARAALIIRAYQGLATEAGRALNILKKDTARIKNVGRLLDDLGGKDQRDAFSNMLEHMQTTGQINNFANESLKATTSDVLLEIWINSLLSGPQTHAVNTFSNGLVSLFSDLETWVAAGIGSLHGGNKISFREAVSYATGTLEGAFKGLKLARTAFNTEIPSGEGKMEARRYQAISAEKLGITNPGRAAAVDKLGRIIRTPGRALLAGDELFKSVARTKKLHQLAMREALRNAKDSAQVRTLYQQYRESPTEEMLDEAQTWADYQTFTKELGQFGKQIQNLAAKHPLMRVLIPFIRTPTNIVKFAIERTPIAPIFKQTRDDLLGKNGNIARDEAMSRMLIGSSIGALTMYLTAQGLITGGGPDDGRERNAMRSNGWQPYSFLIGDKYVAFNRLEPLGMLLGIAADSVEVWEALSEDDQNNLASLMLISISKNLTSKTWLRGISEAVNALTDPDRYGPYYVRNLLGTVVPTGLAQLARVDDPALRDAQTILDKIKSRIPGMTRQVPMRYDILGNEIRLEGAVGPDLLSPFYVAQRQHDPIIAAMKEVDYFPGMPTRKVFGVKLSPDQYSEYIRLAGTGARLMLQGVVRLNAYRMLSVAEKERILEKAFRESKKMARLLLIKRYPDLALQLRAAEARKKLDKMQRSPVGQTLYKQIGYM